MKTILTVLAGSHAHGIETPMSDYDYVSVAVAPLECTLGLQPMPTPAELRERTAPEGVRTRPGDVERVTYELRRYVSLCAQGNPNMLVPLFAHSTHVVASTPLGGRLRHELAPAVVSRQTLERHLGYLDAQRDRMTGQSSHHKPNRPELVEAHGYDTKYAAHALRLAWQGTQLAETGRLTLPMPLGHRLTLKEVRTGLISEESVLQLIDNARAQLQRYVDEGDPVGLPEGPDWDFINDWLVEAQTSR